MKPKSAHLTYECAICPLDTRHYRPEFAGNRGKTHFLLTNLLNANLLSTNWGFLTRAQQTLAITGIAKRTGVSADWLYEWIAEDAALRANKTIPAGMTLDQFLTRRGWGGSTGW